jgi:aspartate kinase
MRLGIVGATGQVGGVMRAVLAEHGINIEMISTSAIRISCVVAEADADRAVQVLHDVYELESTDF